MKQHIYLRGEHPKLDRTLDLARYLVQPRPPSALLESFPEQICQLLPCASCTVYALEGDALVAQSSNAEAPELRWDMGVGVVGLAMEGMRPVVAQDDGSASAELAMPFSGPYGPVGAVSLVWATTDSAYPARFVAEELQLLAALCVPLALAMERGHALLQTARQAPSASASSAATRRVTLSGRSVCAGRALGFSCAFVRPAALARAMPVAAVPLEEQRKRLLQAMSTVRQMLSRLRDAAESSGAQVAFLEPFEQMLEDRRLVRRTLQIVEEGNSLPYALTRTGGEVRRVAQQSQQRFAIERSWAINDLCEALALLVGGDLPDLPRDAVLVGNELTVFDLLVSARHSPAAVLLAAPASPATVVLLDLFGVPAVADLASLFRWVSEGDLVLVDGSEGRVQVNPGRDEIAFLRAERRSDPSGVFPASRELETQR